MAKDMSQEEAIQIIQVMERARQGHLRAKLNEESRNINRKYRTKDIGPAGFESAAVCIQKVFITKQCYIQLSLPFSFARVIFCAERFN